MEPLGRLLFEVQSNFKKRSGVHSEKLRRERLELAIGHRWLIKRRRVSCSAGHQDKTWVPLCDSGVGKDSLTSRGFPWLTHAWPISPLGGQVWVVI